MKDHRGIGTIALSYPPPSPPIVIDYSPLKNAAESFTVAVTLTLGGYESAIAPIEVSVSAEFHSIELRSI